MRAWTARRSIWLMAGLAIALSTPAVGLTQETVTAESQPPEEKLPAEGGGPISECLACDECAAPCRRPGYFRVMPYVWVPGINGDLTVRGVTAPVDVSIDKMWHIMTDDINFGALGQIEASNGTFGILANAVYADVSPSTRVRNLDFSSRVRLAIFDIAATYQPELLSQFLPCGSRFEFLAGVRFNSLSAGLTVTGPQGNSATASGTEDWFDAIVGARFRMPLTQRLTGQVRGDVGGFEWGDSSRFTWNVEATLEYRVSSCCFLFGGYRWLDIDYTRGSGSDQFAVDLNLGGPLAGIGFDF